MKDKICEIEGCQSKAKYNLYRQNSVGKKTWLNVCDSHDREIGAENLKRLGEKNEK